MPLPEKRHHEDDDNPDASQQAKRLHAPFNDDRKHPGTPIENHIPSEPSKNLYDDMNLLVQKLEMLKALLGDSQPSSE